MPDPNDDIRGIIAAAAKGVSRVFARAVGDHHGLVIAGASGLVAAHTMRGLQRLGIRPVAIVDNNPAYWGTRPHGTDVMAPVEAIRRYPDAAYVAAIFTHTPLRQQLESLGATRVVSYAALFH